MNQNFRQNHSDQVTKEVLGRHSELSFATLRATEAENRQKLCCCQNFDCSVEDSCGGPRDSQKDCGVATVRYQQGECTKKLSNCHW